GLREARDPDTRRAARVPPPPPRLDRRRDSRRRHPLRRLHVALAALAGGAFAGRSPPTLPPDYARRRMLRSQSLAVPLVLSRTCSLASLATPVPERLARGNRGGRRDCR